MSLQNLCLYFIKVPLYIKASAEVSEWQALGNKEDHGKSCIADDIYHQARIRGLYLCFLYPDRALDARQSCYYRMRITKKFNFNRHGSYFFGFHPESYHRLSRYVTRFNAE